jgi:hypothetical protein
MLKALTVFISLATLGTAVAAAAPKPAPVCKVTFQVAYLDRLNNSNVGIPPASMKDIDKRLSKLGDVCHADGQSKGDVVFFIHTSPATYHGIKVYTNNSSSSAAAADGNGGAAAAATSSSSTVAVPYSVDYSVFIMDIELPQPDGSFKVIHTFDQKGLYKTVYGIGYGKGKHPIPNVIEAGARWLHDEYLTNSAQTKW